MERTQEGGRQGCQYDLLQVPFIHSVNTDGARATRPAPLRAPRETMPCTHLCSHASGEKQILINEMGDVRWREVIRREVEREDRGGQWAWGVSEEG